MTLNVADLAGAVDRAHAAMATLESTLNEADSKLGDGDTGSMLARVLDGLAAVDLTNERDLGAAFRLLAGATAAATGSSLGTLLGTAFLAAARSTKGEAEIEWTELSPLLAAARDAMAARGKAALGDKTVLDGIDAVAAATAGLDDPASVASAAGEAARAVLVRFRGRPCQIGRARLFPERSKGLDDPGMLAFVRLLEAVARQA